MIGYSKYRFNIWKQKVFLFPPNAMTYIYKFYLTCEKHFTTSKRGVSAGVKLIRCGINCDAAPTGNRGSELIAVCTAEDVVISTVALSVLKRNKSVRCYV